jgi:hypothetical protein
MSMMALPRYLLNDDGEQKQNKNYGTKLHTLLTELSITSLWIWENYGMRSSSFQCHILPLFNKAQHVSGIQ